MNKIPIEPQAVLAYLATPYSSPDPAVREARMKTFYEVDTYLSTQGWVTVSPMYKVEAVKKCPDPVLDNPFFWANYCIKLLMRCQVMIIITSEGWGESTGIKAELDHCRDQGIPVFLLDPNTKELTYFTNPVQPSLWPLPSTT